MRAGDGDDILGGNELDDRLEGGAGNDQFVGGSGQDVLTDSSGDDVLEGGDGNDALASGPGFDLNQGGLGNDFVVGGSDPTETLGGPGDDLVYAGDSSDTVFGDDGDDGDDWLEGGGQSDLLQGDNGAPFQDDPNTPGHDVTHENARSRPTPTWTAPAWCPRPSTRCGTGSTWWRASPAGSGTTRCAGTTRSATTSSAATNSTRPASPASTGSPHCALRCSRGSWTRAPSRSGAIRTPAAGSSVDMAVFSGSRFEYDITAADGTLTVAHVGGTAVDGVDTLRNVEQLEFADGTVAAADLLVTAPDAPAITSVVPGDGRATVTFTPPASDGGRPVTGFLVQVLTGDQVEDGLFAVDPTATSSVVTGLTNGESYPFRVQAVNAVGGGEWSAPSAPVTPAVAPPARTTVTASAGIRSATVQ